MIKYIDLKNAILILWGEAGKPGSGSYEYVDLEKAGGLTMELLWSHP